MSKVNALLSECSSRHGNDPQFLEAVRPMAELILNPATPRRHRPELLQLLTQSCERDSSIRRKCREARESLRRFFAELDDLVRSLRTSPG